MQTDDDRTASLDIWLVRVLSTLLTERSVTQTALRLNQTQPAISTALRRLREALNDPILVRGKAGMAPTEYGASLLDAAQLILRDVDFIATPHGAFNPDRSRRSFRIAAPDYLNDFFMPTLIARFRAIAPYAQLNIHSLNPTLDHATALDAGELDLVIGNWPHPDARFLRDALFADTVVCMMRRDHPLAAMPLTRDAYAAAAHAVPTPYISAAHNAIEIGLARAKLERKVVAMLPYFGIVPQVLLQSDLIFTTTRRFATHYAQSLPLVVVQPPVRFPKIQCYQMWHQAPDRPTDIAWLRALMAHVSAELTRAPRQRAGSGSSPVARTSAAASGDAR